MDKPINVGIVGCGFATATFHAPLIRAVPGLVLKAVSSSDSAKVRAALPGVEAVGSPAELIGRSDLDLIVVPTPNDTHHPLAAAALEAGKHVVVDKPFALDAGQSFDLIARAEKAGRLLSVFHNRRWDADFLTLKQLIGDDRLGRLVHFESHIDRFRPQVRQRWRESAGPGAGLWYDLGPHLLDQALVLFGEPASLSLRTARLREGAESDDWFHAVLDYGDRQAVLHASVVTARPGPRFQVHGLKASWTKEGMDTQEDSLKAGGVPGSVGWGADPLAGVLTVPGSPEEKTPSVPGAYQTYYTMVREALLGRGPLPVAPAEAHRTMRWLDAGRLSATEGRAVTAGR